MSGKTAKGRGKRTQNIVKQPLKINTDKRKNEVGYGQKIKRRKKAPISSSLTIDNNSNPINIINDNKKQSPATEVVTVIPDEIDYIHSGAVGSSSTPTKVSLDAPNVLDDMYDDNLLQGLCEEDLSISIIHNQSNSFNQHDISTTSRLDSLLEDALFNISDEEMNIEQKNSTSINVVSADHVSCYPPNTFYGLPVTVLDCLKEHRGISKLYEWQNSCLCLESVINGINLVYSLPTSGGKTLVAEIQIFQQLLLKKKDVLFVLPFVSIVQEKVRELLPFAETLKFAVDEYAGNHGKIPPRRRLKKPVVYIATIEKANGLVNSLIELNRLNTIGLVVVDEVHMLGEGGKRGATLETCLAKILFVSDSIQIIGMSATLTNIIEVATFLRADHYSSDFRPIELKEFIKLGRCVYSIEVNNDHVNLLPSRNIETITENEGDIDQLSCLVREVIPSSPCLVFCHTRKNCENVAIMLTKCLPRSLKETKCTERDQLLHQLSIEAAGLCPVLAKTIPWGIAYHHSGLTADERRLIEEAYLEKILYVITCTSTLAAGINLPAKRVILRCPLIGRDFMTRSQYKQMIGRAGRSGLSESGESILIIHPQDKSKVLSSLIQGPCDTCSSSLLMEGVESLMSLLLSLIALKLLTSSQDLIPFLKCTLIFQQSDHTHLLSKCNEALSKLLSSDYITMATDSKKDTIDITNMGKAIHKGCIDVSIAQTVYSDLLQSLDCLVLSTDLHLLYIAIPFNMIDSIQPNWTIYFEIITRLHQSETKVAEHLKISVGYISKKAIGTYKSLSDCDSLRYTKFYMALILHHLLKYSSVEGVWLVADMFQCSRGFIQNLIQQSSSFVSGLIHFTEELPELRPLHLLLPSIAQKLSYTVTIHLVPLMEIQGMKQGRALQLFSAGIKSPKDLITCKPEDLCDKIDHLNLFQAKKLVKSAKALINEKVEILQEEVEELYNTLLPDVNYQ